MAGILRGVDGGGELSFDLERATYLDSLDGSIDTLVHNWHGQSFVDREIEEMEGFPETVEQSAAELAAVAEIVTSARLWPRTRRSLLTAGTVTPKPCDGHGA